MADGLERSVLPGRLALFVSVLGACLFWADKVIDICPEACVRNDALPPTSIGGTT